MADKKNPRVTISPEAYRALMIQTAIEGESPGDICSKLILANVCAEAKRALEVIGNVPPDHKTKEGISHKPEEEQDQLGKECGAVTVADSVAKKPKLAHNQAALSRIKELWNSGEHNAAAISRQIGYHRKTTYDNIKKMKESGELGD
jgi:hypothetical protein